MASEQTRETTTITPDLAVLRDQDSDAAQAYRSVRETLRHARDEEPIRSILLADTGSRDQTGEAAANIAASFALNGDPTVLLDLDAGQPALSGIFMTPGNPGLIDWLAGADEDGVVAPEGFSSGIDGLSIIPPGLRSATSNRAALADLLTDRRCQRLISALGATAGRIIFHASVSPVSSQALTVAAEVDAVVLIVRSGATKRTDAQRAKESLQRVGANLLGVVLTHG